jgi:hypothetical protein
MSVEMSPGPETEHHQHPHTGHRWLDITLAVSAVFISLISLFLAIQHGRVMERMMEASTWAFVTVDFSNADRVTFGPHTRLTMRNKGVGPAKIESLEVFYDGAVQAGPRALVSAILKRPEPLGTHRFLRSDVDGMVLSAKEEIDFLDFKVGSYAPDESDALAQSGAKLEFRVCYCSVLDECAVVDTRNHGQRPLAVKACAVPPVPYDSQK